MTYEVRKTVPLQALTRARIEELLSAVKKIIRVPRSFQLSIAVVSDKEIRQANRRYRGKDAPTDVLSFRYEEHLGEVLLSAPRIRAQAKEYGNSITEEAMFLLVHGILHIFGWDHERSAKEAREMRALEEKILHLCGLDCAR